ncbi:pbcV-1 histone H3-lys 27 methyltransferase structure [Caudoviricetes sp.]|nr:pbcV-1 histone H3-lys 27 methyltransferase structure [Caudoviricetes sp.]
MSAVTTQVIAGIEQHLLQQPQASCNVIHRFAPGIYIRELHMPAGTFAIGHYQRYEHLNVFLKGKVLMVNADASLTELAGPTTFMGKPGRKMGHVVEDTVWQNIYATTETDIDTLESVFLIKSAEYLNTLAALGVSPELVEKQSKNTKDCVDLPYGSYKIKVGKSSIEGSGLFATADIVAGEQIAPARINGMRTIAGRYVNHSNTPNAVMVRGPRSDIHLAALTDIAGCRGGLNGEEITVDYSQAAYLTKQIGE